MAMRVTVMRQENGVDLNYTILEMVLMGRAPYRKFCEYDAAEDKLDRVFNILRFMA